MDRRRYCSEILRMERTGRSVSCPQPVYTGSDLCWYHRSLRMKKKSA